MISNNISTITDLRFKTKEVLKKALEEPVFLFHRSTPKGVIMSYENYEELMSTLEDFYDSTKAEEYEKEDKEKVSWISSGKLQKLLFSKS